MYDPSDRLVSPCQTANHGRWCGWCQDQGSQKKGTAGVAVGMVAFWLLMVVVKRGGPHVRWSTCTCRVDVFMNIYPSIHSCRNHRKTKNDSFLENWKKSTQKQHPKIQKQIPNLFVSCRWILGAKIQHLGTITGRISQGFMYFNGVSQLLNRLTLHPSWHGIALQISPPQKTNWSTKKTSYSPTVFFSRMEKGQTLSLLPKILLMLRSKSGGGKPVEVATSSTIIYQGFGNIQTVVFSPHDSETTQRSNDRISDPENQTTVVTSSGRRPASTGRRCLGQVGEGSTGSSQQHHSSCFQLGWKSTWKKAGCLMINQPMMKTNQRLLQKKNMLNYIIDSFVGFLENTGIH